MLISVDLHGHCCSALGVEEDLAEFMTFGVYEMSILELADQWTLRKQKTVAGK
jgi:hypothetical protein